MWLVPFHVHRWVKTILLQWCHMLHASQSVMCSLCSMDINNNYYLRKFKSSKLQMHQRVRQSRTVYWYVDSYISINLQTIKIFIEGRFVLNGTWELKAKQSFISLLGTLNVKFKFHLLWLPPKKGMLARRGVAAINNFVSCSATANFCFVAASSPSIIFIIALRFISFLVDIVLLDLLQGHELHVDMQ